MNQGVQYLLGPQTLADLIALKKFHDAQLRAFQDLWGKDLQPSRTREHLLRIVVIEFGFGRIQSSNFYVSNLAGLFPDEKTILAISELEETGLLIRDVDDRLVPSPRVITWYNHFVPTVMEDVEKVVKSR